MAETAKEKIKQYLDGLPDSEVQKLLRYLEDNYEIAATPEDEKIIERGRKEIENGEYRKFTFDE